MSPTRRRTRLGALTAGLVAVAAPLALQQAAAVTPGTAPWPAPGEVVPDVAPVVDSSGALVTDHPGSTGVTGTHWTGGGVVPSATGKALFVIGKSMSSCSATLVQDDNPDTSVLITAAHCAYDFETHTVSPFWLFIPDYDATPTVMPEPSLAFCASTRYGCWTAVGVSVPVEYTRFDRFTAAAGAHDYAFITLARGGHDQKPLDQVVTPIPVTFTTAKPGTAVDVFGYPAFAPYRGLDLIHTRGPVTRDPKNAKLTYRTRTTMTAGASGGPWLTGLDGGAPTVISVMSYQRDEGHLVGGPVLDQRAREVHRVASTTTGPHVVS